MASELLTQITLANLLPPQIQIVADVKQEFDNDIHMSSAITAANSNSTNPCRLCHEKDLKILLHQWDMIGMESYLKSENIDVDTLKIMGQRHVLQLFTKWNLKLGMQIKFEQKLEEWQKSQSQPQVPVEQRESTTIPRCNVIDCSLPPDDGYAPQQFSSTVLDVSKILNDSSQGRLVIESYKNNSYLTDGARNIVVELIINHMVHNAICMSCNLAKEIAASIINVFPNEFEGYYYLKQRGKKPQGKVYDKYFNEMRQLKKNGMLPKRSYTSTNTSSSSSKDDSGTGLKFELDDPETNIEEHLEAIAQDTCPWTELETHWAATQNYRLHEVRKAELHTDIFDKWKPYTKPMGYKLIDMDFEHLYPSAATNLIDNFGNFANKIIPLFEHKLKDRIMKAMYDDLRRKTALCDNARHCAIFFLLHGVLVPRKKIPIAVDSNKRRLGRYSIRDSQNSFMIAERTVVQYEFDLEQEDSDLQAVINNNPIILISDKIFPNPGEICVYFDEIKYEMTSFLHAVDTCFKIYKTFNIDYPLASSLIWKFVQKYFYEMDLDPGDEESRVNCLISDLSNA